MKKILTIAGSDSGGGAGIQADLKAITVLGGYGMSAVTALTAQNTVGVHGVHPVPADFIRQQMQVVLADIGADAAKTGMLATPQIVTAVAELLQHHKVELLVVDPVMVAKSGDPLLSEEARRTLKEKLLPLARVVTPNLPEAEVLCGFRVRDPDSMQKAAAKIRSFGPRFVFVKGGHLEGAAIDLLYDGNNYRTLEAPRLNNRNTHGTGCTFSAALATFLGQGLAVPDAAQKAKRFITRAIALGLDIGAGHGPANPYAHVVRLAERESVLQELQAALERLLREPIGALVPEVRSNFGYALPGAIDYDEVAAVPGRISQIEDQLVVSRYPAFGVSRHIARVILAALARDPSVRSAINIRYSKAIIYACRAAGFTLASFDRAEEPQEVKEREGSTLEWGTLKALAPSGPIPDMVYDQGELGKEPMIRVLGKNPGEVADKVIRIAAAFPTEAVGC